MLTFSEKYGPSVRFGILSAMLLALLPALAQDMGECVTVYLCTLAGYLALLLVVMLRRPSMPTRSDLLAIKWAFIILFLFATVLLPMA